MEANIPTQAEVESTLQEMRETIETRIDELDQELAGMDAKFSERNELKGSLAMILRVIDPDALPKRKRRTKKELEAEKATAG